MDVRIRDREETIERIELPLTPPRWRPVRILAIVMVVGLVVIAGGWMAYRTVSSQQEAAGIDRASEIQRQRSEALVDHYEEHWRAPEGLGTSRITVAGTGPGLAFVADRQAAFARRAITGTGPGLVAIAELQTGVSLDHEPAGTLGAEHLPGSGPDVVMVDTP